MTPTPETLLPTRYRLQDKLGTPSEQHRLFVL